MALTKWIARLLHHALSSRDGRVEGRQGEGRIPASVHREEQQVDDRGQILGAGRMCFLQHARPGALLAIDVDISLGPDSHVQHPQGTAPITDRCELHGVLEQAAGGREILPVAGAVACGLEVADGPLGEGPGGLVRRRQLEPVTVGGLEVMGDDLLDLGQPTAGGALQPGRQALVELGPPLLGQGPVGGVTHHQMTEAVGVLVERGRIGTHELALDEDPQLDGNLGLGRPRGQLADRHALEHLADHRRAPDRIPGRRFELVETCADQGMDGRRDRQLAELVVSHRVAVSPRQPAGIAQHGNELLDEQRVPLGRRGDPIAECRWQGFGSREGPR